MTWAASWWCGTVGLWVMRLWLLAGMLSSGTWLVAHVVVLEVVALACGVVGALKAKERDYSPGGLAIAALYACGVYLLASANINPTISSAGLIFSGLLLSAWALWHLRGRFTCGGAAWQSLVDKGPYKMVRHPQQLARVMVCVGYAVSGVSFADSMKALCAVVTAVLVLCVEEAFLIGRTEYDAYRRRVKWALVPGVL